jgi:hypothetical protein
MTNTLRKTVVIPADRRLYVDIPPDMPTGSAEITVRVPVTTAPQNGGDFEDVCPICAKYYDPKTGQPPYNAETMAALAEGDAMLRGEIPSATFHSLDELLADLRS